MIKTTKKFLGKEAYTCWQKNSKNVWLKKRSKLQSFSQLKYSKKWATQSKQDYDGKPNGHPSIERKAIWSLRKREIFFSYYNRILFFTDSLRVRLTRLGPIECPRGWGSRLGWNGKKRHEKTEPDLSRDLRKSKFIHLNTLSTGRDALAGIAGRHVRRVGRLIQVARVLVQCQFVSQCVEF